MQSTNCTHLDNLNSQGYISQSAPAVAARRSARNLGKMSQDFDMDYDYPVTVPAKRSHSSSANLNPRGGSHVGGRGRGRWGGQSRGRGGGQQRGGVRDNPTYWRSRNEHSVSALQSPPAHASPSAAAQTGTGSSTSPRIASGSRKGPAGRLARAWVRSGVEPPPGDASVIQLTIMTYNVLCNDYVEAGFYPHCSRHDLHPDVRYRSICVDDACRCWSLRLVTISACVC